MSIQKIETVVDHKCALGEGPLWDHKKQRILWIDIVKGEIHQFAPKTKAFRTFSVGQMVGSIALCDDQTIIAALQSGFSFIDLDNETTQHITDPEKHLSNNRFNEGKCDPMGRFWAGTISLSEEPKAASLYALHPDLSVEKKIAGVTISNGMAWSLDHSIFYYVDTPTGEVAAFDYDKYSGEISNKKAIIKINENEGFPDGMTIDNEGMLWIAHWDGWKITRWNPFTGTKLNEINIPVSKVTSCTFGGPDFQDLYITSASVDLSNAELSKQPLAGSLFVIKNSGYKGLPSFEFRKL
jgi:sugar lactone lactonase YvrE